MKARLFLVAASLEGLLAGNMNMSIDTLENTIDSTNINVQNTSQQNENPTNEYLVRLDDYSKKVLDFLHKYSIEHPPENDSELNMLINDGRILFMSGLSKSSLQYLRKYSEAIVTCIGELDLFRQDLIERKYSRPNPGLDKEVQSIYEIYYKRFK